MEDTIRQRVFAIFQEKQTNPTKFSGEDKAMQKRLSRQLNGGASITFETISSILEAFPDVSSEWLLRGDGSMYKSENTTQIPSQAEENINTKSTMNVLIKTIEYYQKEVERLVENIDELRNENEILKSELERKHLENERV